MTRTLRHGLSRRRFLRISSALALGAAAAPPWRAWSRTPLCIERATYTMGGIATVQAYAEDERLCHLAIDEAFRAMKSVDAMMSVYSNASALSALNRSGSGRGVSCPDELVGILESAREYSRITGGAFDITLQPLMELYGFLDGPGAVRVPSDREIADVSAGCGMENIIVDRRTLRVAFAHPRTKIDLGGIAVGYALDRAGAILRSHGIASALLNHSGDLLAVGAPPDDASWEIGITDPLRPDEVITTAAIRDEALSSSGNYRNIRTIEGRTFGHILDPSTGKPASALLGSTIIAPSALAADALSTGTFVLGRERSEEALRLCGARLIAVERVSDGSGPAERLVR